jgi:hypothetical protein
MAFRQGGACARPPSGATPGNRTIPFLIFDLRLIISEQAERQLAQSSLQNSTRVGQHHGDRPYRKSQIVNHKFFKGSWQTSNALALQAS